MCSEKRVGRETGAVQANKQRSLSLSCPAAYEAPDKSCLCIQTRETNHDPLSPSAVAGGA